MKNILLLLVLFAYVFIARGQTEQPPVFLKKGFKNVNRFFDDQLNLKSVAHEIKSDTAKAVRVIFSFKINEQGNLADLIIHEKTSDLLAKEVERILSLTSGAWVPYTINGKANLSPRIFWSVCVSCSLCDNEKETLGKENRNYLQHYKYSKLAYWSANSIIYPPEMIIVYPPAYY